MSFICDKNNQILCVFCWISMVLLLDSISNSKVKRGNLKTNVWTKCSECGTVLALRKLYAVLKKANEY